MISDPERVTELFWHPFRVRILPRRYPGVCASLRPPATFLQPFGLQSQLMGQVKRTGNKVAGQRNRAHANRLRGGFDEWFYYFEWRHSK